MKIVKVVTDIEKGPNQLTIVGGKTALEYFFSEALKDFSKDDIVVMIESDTESFIDKSVHLCKKHDIRYSVFPQEYSVSNYVKLYEKHKISYACILLPPNFFIDAESIRCLEKNYSAHHDVTLFCPMPDNNASMSSGPVVSLSALKKGIDRKILHIRQMFWDSFLSYNVIEDIPYADIIPSKFNLNSKSIKKINHLIEHCLKSGIEPSFKNILNLKTDFPKEPQMPAELKIELTSECNLSCTFCPHTIMKRPSGHMSVDVFNKIIHELKQTSHNYELEFSGFGEPMLHPEFFEMFTDKTFEYHWKPYLYTNGTKLDSPEKLKKLIDIAFNCIFISVDAYFPESYKKLKKAPMLEKILFNIEQLHKIKKKLSQIYTFRQRFLTQNNIAITMVKTADTKSEYPKFFVDWGYDLQLRSKFKYNDEAAKYKALSAEYFKKDPKSHKWIDHFQFYQHSMAHVFKYPLYFWKNSPILVEHSIINHFNTFCGEIEDMSLGNYVPLDHNCCKKADRSLTILYNGDVVRCPQDFNASHVIGNVTNQSIEEIWNNNPYRNKSERIFENELCSRCADHYYP